METAINKVITALMELEAKGCHRVHFEYGNGLFHVRISKGEVDNEQVVYEKTICPSMEQEHLDGLYNRIEDTKSHVKKTAFQCYKREFIKGEKIGKWAKTRPAFEIGDNATSAMTINGSGYLIDDPDNSLQYFVDMIQLSENQ
jgi:hypothetical protein